jgi:helix-turn-helix protein
MRTGTAVAGLGALAESLPPETPVPVPAGLLREVLCEGQPGSAHVDPTVEDIAVRFGRRPSTVRGWCEQGRFPGAYKLHGREWRIPPAALEGFEAGVRGRATANRARVQSLGGWRHAS